jgi:hypothetical protein
MSGNTGEYDAPLLLAMGAVRVFPKPFDLDALTRAVAELLGHP